MEYPGTDGRKVLITVPSSGRRCAAAVRASAARRQIRDVAARAILQHELKSAGGAQTQDGRQAEGERKGFRNLGEPALRRTQDGVQLRILTGALLPGLQRGDDRRHIGIRGAGGDVKAAQHEILVHAGKLADHVFDLARGVVGAIRGSAVGETHGDEERALIFIGQEASGQSLEQTESQE